MEKYRFVFENHVYFRLDLIFFFSKFYSLKKKSFKNFINVGMCNLKKIKFLNLCNNL